jgi:two-component system cell cycle sensor histidine kinase/response regulator CckA
MLLVAGICGVMAAAAPLLSDRPLPLMAFYGGVLAASLIAWRLVISGRSRWAITGFLTSGWLAITASAVLLGGVRSPSYSAYVAMVLLAGLVWSERAALVMGLASIAAATAFALVPGSWLPAPIVDLAPWRFLASVVLQIGVVILALRLATASVRRNLAGATENAHAAIEAKQSAERRVRQQAAIARLGARALATRDMGALLDEFVSEVARTLDAEFVKVLELAAGGDHLLLTSGVGWDAGLVGQARVPVGADSQAGFTLASKVPVLVRDLLSEQRFAGPELLTRHGVRSGVSVVIQREADGFGILAAHSRAPAFFHDEDAMFLQSAAHLLSTALSRERLEARLARQGRLEALGRFAGGVAHDFNNLLTVILGYADAIEDGASGLDPGSAAKEIQGAGERATALTRDLLAFARREPAVPTLLDLNDVVSRSLRLLQRLVAEDVHLQVTLAPEPCELRADASHVERVLVNLVINARDAQPGGGRIAIETQRASRQGKNFVRLLVSDRGSGMAPNVLAHIFEPFFTTKESGKGSGLGLSTVYGLVSQLGGQISVTSEVGAGTQVHIEFPMASEVSAEAASVLPPDPTALRAGASETILVAEDDAALRTLLREWLERSGYAVLEAADGPAAISLIGTHPGPILALITDIVMPDASGFDVAARFRAVNPDGRVVYLSGYLSSEAHLAELERADVVFVAKPFRMRDLEAALRKALAPRASPALPAGAPGSA